MLRPHADPPPIINPSPQPFSTSVLPLQLVDKFPRHHLDSLSVVTIIIDQECDRFLAVEATVGHKEHNPPIRPLELLYFYSNSLDSVQNVTTGNSTHLASFHSLRSFTYLRHIDPYRQGHTARFLRRCRLWCVWKLRG